MNNQPPSSLAKQNILITGGGGRIGFATAKAALRMGADVILSDISSDRLETATRKLSDISSGKIYTIKCDITTEKGITNLINNAASASGPINSAVHSAYPTSKGWGTPFEQLKATHLHEDLANQLGGAILFSKKIMQHFQENDGGSLVHLSSIQGINAPKFEHYAGTSMTSPIEYSAIKSGIISITKWLAKYYSGQNIRVNCISPGGILDNQSDKFLKKYRESCTNYGMLTAEQIASTITFLMSPASEAINGQNIVVDDGWSL